MTTPGGPGPGAGAAGPDPELTPGPASESPASAASAPTPGPARGPTAGPSGEPPLERASGAIVATDAAAATAPAAVAALASETALAPEAALATDAAAEARDAAPRGRQGRLLGRIRLPALRSKRGLFVAFLLVAGIGSLITAGGVVAISWTETADFCGRCHAMGPELKAYEMSPHREVACAECHVEPGIDGWIKAKLNGTKQLFQVLTGQFPKPIPAPDHADLPATSDTCLKCHDVAPLVANGGPVRLVLDTRYRADEPNTRDVIALVVRPAGFGGNTATQGVHWHIDSDVEYVRADPKAQKIDLVTVTNKDGTKEQFIASNEVAMSTDVQPDIDRLTRTQITRRMDCIDCHNRAGHGIPGIDQSIDDAIEAGQIDQGLPYVKREASDRLSVLYATTEDADRAIDGLRTFYEGQYPLVAKDKSEQIDQAISALKTVYRLVATPDMQVSAATYPNNLGHQTAPGCFRCHDGAHYKVVDGALTSETIPSACATCHTFPQIGATESGVLIGQRPATHNDKLWVFDHKSQVSSIDPANTSCGACHTRTYCENCHKTPAVQVPHDDMVYNHAKVVAKVGAQACSYCHQPVYCAQCHSNQVMPNPFSDLIAPPATPVPLATSVPPATQSP